MTVQYVAFEAIFLKDTYKHGEMFTLILSVQVMIKLYAC